MHPEQPHSSHRRTLAAGMAMLVFVLGLLAQTPALHGWLHQTAEEAAHQDSDAPGSHDDNSCAISLLAHTAEAVLPALGLLPPVWHTQETPCFSGAIPKAALQHLLPPGRGPPAPAQA